MIQKIIQYFAMEANEIANRASNIDSQTYIRKMQESTGILDFKTSDNKLITLDTKLGAEFIMEKTNQELKKCYTRYGDTKELLFMDKDLFTWTEAYNQREINKSLWTKMIDSVSDAFKKITEFRVGPTTIDISLNTCKQLIQEQINAEKTLKEVERAEKKLEAATQASGKGDGVVKDQQKVANELSSVQDMIKNNERMYGWLNSLIVPSSVLLLEIQSLVKNTQVQSTNDMKNQIEIQNNLSARANGQSEALSDSLIEKGASFISSYLFPLTLPGASQLRTTILYGGMKKDTDGNWKLPDGFSGVALRTGVFGAPCAYAVYKLSKEGALLGSNILTGLVTTTLCVKAAGDPDSAYGFIASILIIYAIYTSFLEYLPTVIASIASILAFTGFFITLCKYFYISPFVVAFALTTKRVDKIINFLVTGITIFFKPVLIVLFIYLALFLHHIIQEIFILTSLTQFSVLPESFSAGIDLFTPIATGIIKSLLMFFWFAWFVLYPLENDYDRT